MATTNIQKFAGDVEVSGTVTGDGSGLTTLNGSQVTTGTVAASRIANLDGSKITSGTLGAARIPNLDAGKITTGTLGAARIPNLDAGKITSGELGTDRIPDLDADKITSGTITTAVDTASDVKAASLYTDRYIYHEGDTNTYMDFSSNDTWRVVTSGVERLRVASNGNVGINTATPYAKFHVQGESGDFTTVGNPGSTSYFISTSSFFYGNGQGDFNGVSIYGSGDILAGKWMGSFSGAISASDERIKKEIVDVEDGSALETLRLLKPKRYKYRDEVKRGSEPVWGFIAQEVRDTLPYATQTRRECIPTIYELANVSGSNVITFTNFNTSNLQSNATSQIKLFDVENNEHLVKLVSVLDEHNIQVHNDLSSWMGAVDEDGNVVSGNQIFVYGEEVNDFLFLQKDAIWTVATSALQEVDRQLQAEKAKVATLETQLTSVLARLDALESA